jgi:hypothetical protein
MPFKSWLIGLIIKFYFWFFGIDLRFYFDGYSLGTDLVHDLTIKRFNLNDWEYLRENYGYNIDNFIEDSVLFLDAYGLEPFGVNLQNSYRKIFTYFSTLLNENKALYLYIKSHPDVNNGVDIEKFMSSLGERCIRLPSFIPSELIENKFKIYYTINSTGILHVKDFSQCYSLYNLLVFDTPDSGLKKRIEHSMPKTNYL